MRIEKLFNRLSLNYLISFLIISATIFIFVAAKVRPLNLYIFYVTISLSILIGYQFAEIKYFYSNIKLTFIKLNIIFKEDYFRTYFDYLDKKIQKSKIYYFAILLVIIPFVLLEIIRYWRWRITIESPPPYFSLIWPFSKWTIILDIINHMFGYLMLFLLAIIVGIIINLIVIINELNSNPLINIDIFHTDEMGGLRPLRNFVIIVVSNYFITITLAIISYISPIAVISYETVFLISILFLGVIFFIITQKTIRNLINKGIEFELGKINGEYKKTYNKLINIIANNKFNKDELEKLSFILDTLEKEKIRIKQISPKRYDLSAIATFISSFLIPTVTLIETIRGFIT
ncbi:hypothetical protein [Candidatus Methanoperedens nitratireducens]|uniref:Uncharacterized protein n=1 Tax=Candidatus Methanoperedens nitratireducens TaxID=1392998 RepID=A0A284VQ30_9EURY|nr:hypothetical protein [Candidatus Methanoperedens nitroreducens]SNQ61385.1 conserved membrane hypothetical protein [Candidatus Methanoperedens nitroreducens]